MCATAAERSPMWRVDPCAGEALLHDVFGRGARTGHAHRQGHVPHLVAGDEHAEAALRLGRRAP